jgi:hypothetical protein
MWSAIGAAVDVAHALLMAAWVLGLPLLFWSRRPAASRAFAAFALMFVLGNVASRVFLGECFLTRVARACWERAAAAGEPVPRGTEEWFTVRLASTVFRLTPSHQAIKAASEALIGVTALGVLTSRARIWHRTRTDGGPGQPRKLDRVEGSKPCASAKSALAGSATSAATSASSRPRAGCAKSMSET